MSASNSMPRRLTTYREVTPPPYLHDHVVCFWQRRAGDEANTARVLPDGCIDLIWAGEASPVIAGPMTTAIVPSTGSATEILGVRFRPGSAPALLGVPAAELLNQHLPLRAIWSGRRYQRWAEVAERDGLASQIDAIAALIASQYARDSDCDRLVGYGARWLAAHPAGRLEDLTRLSGLSERQMRRRFDVAIGYGPKKLQRILRLQRLLWLASQKDRSARSLGPLAYAAGYADQPHMTREVLALTGASPRVVLQDENPHAAVADLFKTRLT